MNSNTTKIPKNWTTLIRLGQILEETIVFEMGDLAAFINVSESVLGEKILDNLLLLYPLMLVKRSNCKNVFTHLFPMHPFSAHEKVRNPYDFLIFSGDR